ncbi:MAG: hypothetical protein K9N38_06415 [Candidatus Marinimicrobia bacterium]|nr:hypothetical protein [Candidatus Neomarinimicrobiota bacterium]
MKTFNPNLQFNSLNICSSSQSLAEVLALRETTLCESKTWKDPITFLPDVISLINLFDDSRSNDNK